MTRERFNLGDGRGKVAAVPFSGVVGGRFLVGPTIAVGGMGNVYRAQDQETGGEVALKELALDGAEAAARFEREAVVLSTLEHPNIVRYVAHGQHLGRWYLAMGYVAGEPLSARITREGLTIDESVQVAMQLARALGALHEKGLVHRDIKPPNLMVPTTGITPLTLVDFGLVRKTEGLLSLTRTGVAVGSPGYMSPEQARGEKTLVPSSDVYALGCVLYLCLTGHRAFPGEHAVAVQAKILAYDPPSPMVRNPEVSPALSALVMRMLARDQPLRPQTGTEALEQLQHIAPTGSTIKTRLRLRAPSIRFASPPDVTAEVVVRARTFAIAATPPNESESSDEVEQPPQVLERLNELAQRYDANLAVMPDGTCVFVARASADLGLDRVVPACHLALAVAGEWPEWVVAMALGGEAADEVVDRVMHLLAAQQMQAYLAQSEGIRTDEESVRRGGPLLECINRDNRHYLVAVRT